MPASYVGSAPNPALVTVGWVLYGITMNIGRLVGRRIIIGILTEEIRPIMAIPIARTVQSLAVSPMIGEGSGEEEEEPEEPSEEEQEASRIADKAKKTTGNDGEVASSKEIAEKAAEEFLGPGARPIRDRAGNVVGKISADGTRVVRYTSVNKPNPYINLENKATGETYTCDGRDEKSRNRPSQATY